jgi:hypothetical protein
MLIEDHLKYDDPVLEQLNNELITKDKSGPVRIGVIYLGA